MAKRSPILGYNHNARYRGLVFHVQTEDSGVLAPHLFTHLFHHGVIVSTRKYVYDSGATEEVIKSLMQAQHKAVMKDLRRGHFDDKIDQYLGGTPGLLPRGVSGDAGDADQSAGLPPVRSSQGLAAVEPPPEAGDEQAAAVQLDGALAIGREATIEEPALALRPTEQAVEPPAGARTTTAERTSGPSQVRTSLPAEAPPAPPPPVLPRHAREIFVDDSSTLRMDSPGDSLEITIQLDEPEEADEVPVLHRRPLEAETGPWDASDGVPGMLPGPATIRNPGDATGPVGSVASGPITGPLSQRAAKAVGAASLPPARPIARPASRPAMVPPQVVSRPLPADGRVPPQNDAVEVYAPAPPSAELPAQQPPERPGQYSQHKKISSRIPSDAELRDGPRPLHPQQGTIPQIARQGSAPAIPQPMRQVSTSQITQPRTATPVPVARTGTPTPTPQRVTPPPMPVPARTGTPQQPATIPQQPAPIPTPPRGGVPALVEKQPSRPIAAVVPPGRPTPIPIPVVRPPSEAPRARTPTPQRVSLTQQAGAVPGSPGLSPGRTGTPNRESGVVMTRPAVIVGAPPKPGATSQRVRKAREDEGRGFGQGLISEKSLDEVILAYLSEDGEDK